MQIYSKLLGNEDQTRSLNSKPKSNPLINERSEFILENS